MRVAEIEFAFRFGRELPPRPSPYEIAEVMDAVATLHPAIEIPDSRYEDFCAVGAPQLIADNACANLFVLGRAVEGDWRDADLAKHPVVAFVTGKSQHNGTGAAVLGDPRIALTWIVNELSGLGIALQPGQVVITGTCVTPISVEAGDEVSGDFGRFGVVSGKVRLRAGAGAARDLPGQGRRSTICAALRRSGRRRRGRVAGLPLTINAPIRRHNIEEVPGTTRACALAGCRTAGDNRTCNMRAGCSSITIR